MYLTQKNKTLIYSLGTMLLYINDTLRVEGRLHSNGYHGDGTSGGGGAGGSLLLNVFHLDGSGQIEAMGGSGISSNVFKETCRN